MLANHKGEIPFLVLLIPFLLGIALGLGFSADVFLIWVLPTLLLFTFCFIALNISYSYLGIYKTRWIGGILIHLILFFTGWLSVSISNQLNNRDHFAKYPANHLVIRINNEPALKNGLLRFTGVVEHTAQGKELKPTSGTLLVAIKDSLADMLNYGDRLLIPATYTTVDPPFNPAEFNYKQYLAHQNIHHQTFLYPGQCKIINRLNGNPVTAYSLKLRKQLVDKLKHNLHDTSAIAVASTLILGYKADMSNELLQAYSKTGTIHILSVSGGHVGIIYLLLNIAFSFLGRYRSGKIIKAILIIFLIWCYTLLTGLSPAACRAAVMISMVIIGTTYSRYINTLNILAVSAFFMLLHNPFLIADVGFQLSYLAVAGMVVLQPVIYQWFTVDNKWLNKLWAACSVSIAAQVITFPLSAFYFHQFPVYFLVSNLFIIIPAQIILCTGMFFLILPSVPLLSPFLAWLLENSILAMNKVLAIIEHAPFASIGKIWLSHTEYILLYMAMACLFYFLFSKRFRLLNLGLVLILALSLSVSIKRSQAFQNNSIAFLNLRKHQGIVFKQGDKAVILTDLNPIDKNYQYSVQPYLDSMKVADTAVYTLTKKIESTFVRKYQNLIQFNNKKLLIVDKSVAGERFPEKLKVDYLYITGNPHLTVNNLNENFIYSMLIIDGNNSNKLIADMERDAKRVKVPYYVLKRNKSLTIASN